MTDDTYRWIELTDGAHFENFGLYEMVLRRCHNIVVVDAGADPDCQFEDLGNALRKIQIDLGIPIRFNDGIKMKAGAKPDNRYCAVATIDYGCVDDDATLPARRAVKARRYADLHQSGSNRRRAAGYQAVCLDSRHLSS